jgi:hypothetical protein
MEHSIDHFPPVPSSETLMTHSFFFRVLDLDSSLPQLPNSSGIPYAIHYLTPGSYLGMVLGRKHQGWRTSGYDLTGMGASDTGLIHSHR